MVMSLDCTLQQMQGFVKEYIMAAKMYHHLFMVEDKKGNFTFQWRKARGECMGKARFWRQRINALYGI